MSLCKTCKPTFAEAKTALMEHLRSAGWKMSGPLKVPHATSPCGKLRLWFKSQAIWYDYDSDPRTTIGGRSLGTARSTHDDVRSMSPADFVARQWAFVEKYHSGRQNY
jgi:hypothetical protein